MPVTKTAKRALRSSLKKRDVNSVLISMLEAKVRAAKKSKSEKGVRDAISMVDKAAKKHIIHKNKASRMKGSLQGLLPKSKKISKKTAKGKSKSAR